MGLTNIDETINLPELVVTPKGVTTSNSGTETPSKIKYFRIKVQPNDNLTKIAKRYNTTVEELSRINNLKNDDLIYAGKELRVSKKESKNLYYATTKEEAIQNIVKVRKIDKKNAERIIDQAISTNQIKFDGTPQLIMPTKKFAQEVVEKYKEKDALEKRKLDPRSKDFNTWGFKDGSFVRNQNAAWKENPEIMQSFRDAGDATGYGAAVVGLSPIIVPTVASTFTSVPSVIKYTIANPKQAAINTGKFILDQIPWIAGVEASNSALDYIAGNNFNTENFHYDKNHWANNRYLRGGLNAMGATGGVFVKDLGRGIYKYGTHYLNKAFNPLIQKYLGQATSGIAGMEGMAASEHMSEELNIENPYTRGLLQTAGMIIGDNIHRYTMNSAKKLLGKSINANYEQGANEIINGNYEQGKALIKNADKKSELLNHSLISRALDVKGSESNPITNSIIQHIPILGAMEIAAGAEDIFGTDFLYNPLVQTAMIKLNDPSKKLYSNIAYTQKKKSGLKSTISDVVDEMIHGKHTATGTYGINVNSLPAKKILFPDLDPKSVTFEMIDSKLQNMSKQELLLFTRDFRQANSTFNHFDNSYGEKGYLDKEHGKGNNSAFTSAGEVHQGIKRKLPKDFTTEQFLASVAGEGAGSRHGFGFQYGTMIPKNSSGLKNIEKAEFMDNNGNIKPVLIKVSDGYLLHPDFKSTSKGFRGQDAFVEYKDGKMWFSNVAGHNGFIIRIPNESGNFNFYKIGVDTPGYGDTAKRYKGASQTAGTFLGKGLDYFTEKPQYTIWVEPLKSNNKLFGNTTSVQSGKSKRRLKYSSVPTFGFDPYQISLPQVKSYARPTDYLNALQNKKVEQNSTPEAIAQKNWNNTIESINNFEYTSKLNKNFGTSFTEGTINKILDKISSGISHEYSYNQIYRIKDFLTNLKKLPEISQNQKERVDKLLDRININNYEIYSNSNLSGPSFHFIETYYKNNPELSKAPFEKKRDAFNEELQSYEGNTLSEKYQSFVSQLNIKKWFKDIKLPNFYKKDKKGKQIINSKELEKVFIPGRNTKIKKEYYFGLPEDIRNYIDKNYQYTLYKKGGKL